MKTRRGVQETASDKLAVCFTCEWCGARIELIPTERGTEIANAQAFLAQHAGCLRQRSRE